MMSVLLSVVVFVDSRSSTKHDCPSLCRLTSPTEYTTQLETFRQLKARLSDKRNKLFWNTKKSSWYTHCT